MGNKLNLTYTYHISGAIKTIKVTRLSDNSSLFTEELYYEDCGSSSCTPQYNGNISRMAHKIAVNGGKVRLSDYTYDFMNRLITVDDLNETFDEAFAYDMQGRITMQRRGSNAKYGWGGEYTYYKNSNKLEKVNQNIGDIATSKRNMNVNGNFVYDSEGNLIEDRSKSLKISYDWRGMPVEFVRRNSCIDIREQIVCDSTKLLMAYDGSGRRVSKTRMRKAEGGDWETELVTHYTGIGTEIREDNMNGTRVVVNLPQGLGRYGVEDAVDPFKGIDKDKLAGYIPSAKFEWYLKNHLGSTMLVYGTSAYDDSDFSKFQDGVQAVYDYRAFGEQVDLEQKGDKVTENFTGKEKDDETELNYFGARYLDPMLGMWTSVDPMREYANPYSYLRGNPINLVDPTGMAEASAKIKNISEDAYDYINEFQPTDDELNVFLETYDKFADSGVTKVQLTQFFNELYLDLWNGDSPDANGYHKNGFVYLTKRALNMDDSEADFDLRLRSTIFHESAHKINYDLAKKAWKKANDPNKNVDDFLPYPRSKHLTNPTHLYQPKGCTFNCGGMDLGKEFELRQYGKDY